ncbi:hypothetical protein [Acidovorax cavernicola]|uniref:hypothetical protein n=1 Tax=Acidovorax cavernicola TaxID=1675792 RepID=UPI0011C4A713|nr:hypothetical protein [Acidovorax cavernicola]
MTYVCPHCHQPGIAAMAKRWSSRASPAVCGLCGKLSHVLASTSSGIGVAGLLIVVLSGIAAAAWDMAPLVLLGLGLAVANNFRAWRRATLWPISKESADNARKVGWFVAGLLALFGLGS